MPEYVFSLTRVFDSVLIPEKTGKKNRILTFFTQCLSYLGVAPFLVWIISNESNKYYYRSKLFKDRNKKEKAIFDRHGLSGFSSAEGCFRQPKQVTFTDRAVCVSV